MPLAGQGWAKHKRQGKWLGRTRGAMWRSRLDASLHQCAYETGRHTNSTRYWLWRHKTGQDLFHWEGADKHTNTSCQFTHC